MLWFAALIPFMTAGLLVRSAKHAGSVVVVKPGSSYRGRLVRSFRFWSGGLHAAVVYVNLLLLLFVLGVAAKDIGRPIRPKCDFHDMYTTGWLVLGMEIGTLLILIAGVDARIRWGRRRTILAHAIALVGILWAVSALELTGSHGLGC